MHDPITIDDWQAAWRSGAQPAERLLARRETMARRGAPVYLQVIDAAALQKRIDELVRLERAHASRAALLDALPLWGVPFAVKDNIDVAGFTTTAACPAFAHTPERSAGVVQRLLDAGAVVLAKTNLDQFATGLVGTRSPFGAPASVFSSRHVSGGSSSGSAVAVALGDVPFALGTDTAGSGRVPAAFNHIVGLKPTPGRIGSSGMVPACRSIDCTSIFALTVSDAAGVLAIAEGPDPADPFSRFEPGAARLPARLRIGIPVDAGTASQPHMAAGFATACAAWRTDGHQLCEIDFSPLHDVAALLYDGPWVAERHLVLGDLLESDPGAIDPVVRSVVANAARFSAGDAFAARYRLQALARRADAIWQQCDVLLVPTTPRHPTFDEVAADPIGANSALGRYTNFVNLLGWCALALPASLSTQRMPVGITLIARGGFDAALAALGTHWQTGHAAAEPLGATGRTIGDAPPARLPTPASEATLPIAVVGAHLSRLPLNHQLTELGATLVEATRTAPRYRLHALPNTTPRKPGLQRLPGTGSSIDLEVWAVPMQQVGRLLAQIPAPLGLGTVELEDGRSVHGFICEGVALEGAEDVSHHGGWRAYLSSLNG